MRHCIVESSEDVIVSKDLNGIVSLQERWQRVVEVCELRKSAQVFRNLWIVGGESKEVRENSKSIENSGFQLTPGLWHVLPSKRPQIKSLTNL